MAKTKQEKVIPESKHRYKKEIEAALANRVVDNEYNAAVMNNQLANDDYLSYIDMLNCERSDKKYDWLSNVTTAEFTSLHLMSQSMSASQNFSTRDFVEVYIGNKNSVPAAQAEKRLITNTLNQRELFYFHKLMRANSAKDLDGVAYIRCWWEQKLKPGIVGTETVTEESDVDIFGEPMIDRANQIPDVTFREVPVEGELVEYDRFNFDIIDRRDLFTSSEYTYSLQEKKWVIIRYNTTVQWLEDHKEEMEFFNLDILRETYIRGGNRGDGTHTDDYGIEKGQESDRTPVKDWLIVERYGDEWVKVITDEEGNETGVEPGINEHGDVMEGAELRKVVSAFAISDTHRIMIRFQKNKYMSATGQPYIPLIRWICYVHPSKDDGMGDGKCSKELQTAMDDTVNISNDRVTLATLVNFVAREGIVENNDSLYIEPEHIIKVQDPVNDIRELQISDNISGAMAQTQFLKGQMQQAHAINPSPSASIPVQTATAEASAEARTNMRNRYKELSAEHTFYCELYWMISQMHWQFAREETLVERIGIDRVGDFDPSLSYSYKPITSAIETEHGKRAKTQTYLQMIQAAVGFENPKTAALLNIFFSRVLELQGAEWEEFADSLLDENVPGGGSTQGSVPNQQPLIPPSNEQGVPQSNLETLTREVAQV